MPEVGRVYPSEHCRDCGRGIVGRFGESAPVRCPSCEAIEERRKAHAYHERRPPEVLEREALEREGRKRRHLERQERNARLVAMLAEPDPPSYAEVGRRFGLSRNRVKQIHMAAQDERRRRVAP